MCRCLVLTLALQAILVQAEVRVSVEQEAGSARIDYECTAGEVVKTWALDVTVDQGSIQDVSGFFRGPSTASAQGYGIFPASFRDHITFTGAAIDWDVPDYSPVAPQSDRPADTLPGLGSSGVTLEFAAVWDPSDPEAVPLPSGTLCTLQISEAAQVSVSENVARGGVLPANPDQILAPVFTGAFIKPPEITGYFEAFDIFVITYSGGTLERADALDGPWITTSSTNDVYAEFESGTTQRFFRVRSP